MKQTRLIVLLTALAFAGAALAAERPQPERSPSIPATFGHSAIEGWSAPDNRTLIIDTYGYGRFKATLANECRGLRFADVIGFQTFGPVQLDKFTTLRLPHGERCMIKTLEPYPKRDA